jgi:hypothetical protein
MIDFPKVFWNIQKWTKKMSIFQNPNVLLKQKNVNLQGGNLFGPQNNIFQRGLKK